MDMAAEEYAGEICVFTELGWLDNDMVSDDELIQADIETLPSEIGEALGGDDYAECVAKADDKMASMAPECDSSYTEEEMEQLMELVNGVAHTKCFMAIFKTSCGSNVENTLASMAGSMVASMVAPTHPATLATYVSEDGPLMSFVHTVSVTPATYVFGRTSPIFFLQQTRQPWQPIFLKIDL